MLLADLWRSFEQAFRFGVEDAEALKAVDMAFELAPAPSPAVYKGSMKTLALVCCWQLHVERLFGIRACSTDVDDQGGPDHQRGHVTACPVG